MSISPGVEVWPPSCTNISRQSVPLAYIRLLNTIYLFWQNIRKDGSFYEHTTQSLPLAYIGLQNILANDYFRLKFYNKIYIYDTTVLVSFIIIIKIYFCEFFILLIFSFKTTQYQSFGCICVRVRNAEARWRWPLWMLSLCLCVFWWEMKEKVRYPARTGCTT